jgi:integrase
LVAGCYPVASLNGGAPLTTLVGLLASTGLRSGEALRLDRADVDLVGGVLQIRKTKFRKAGSPHELRDRTYLFGAA